MRRHLVGAILFMLAFGTLATPASAGGISVQNVRTELDFPAAFAVGPGGRIVYAERFTGEIRVFNPATGNDTLVFTVTNVATSGEQGLLGVALHPQLTSGRPFLYAYATRETGSGLQNQILRIRLRLSGDHTSSVIFSSDVTPTNNHNGGVIHFGPDGYLYAQIGDAQDPANAQDLTVRAGKIVRMTARGGVPPDNPFVGVAGDDYVYSFGFRNGYGFAWDPQTEEPWETQNGPGCNDEINKLERGGNFAWGPNQTCLGTAPGNTNQDGPLPRLLPKAWYVDTTAPTGIEFCDGCGLTGSEGHMFFGEWNTGRIREVVLSADRMSIVSQTIPIDRANGILSLARGADGTIYFSDQNGIYKLVNA